MTFKKAGYKVWNACTRELYSIENHIIGDMGKGYALIVEATL